MSYVQSLATTSDIPSPTHTHTGNKNVVLMKQDKNTVIKYSENSPNLDHILVERSLDPRYWRPTWVA